MESQGRVFTWGCNEFGQLGHGDSRSRKLPTMLLSLKRKQITQISIGDGFMAMLGKDTILVDQTTPLQVEPEQPERLECQKKLEFGSALKSDYKSLETSKLPEPSSTIRDPNNFYIYKLECQKLSKLLEEKTKENYNLSV